MLCRADATPQPLPTRARAPRSISTSSSTCYTLSTGMRSYVPQQSAVTTMIQAFGPYRMHRHHIGGGRRLEAPPESQMQPRDRVVFGKRAVARRERPARAVRVARRRARGGPSIWPGRRRGTGRATSRRPQRSCPCAPRSPRSGPCTPCPPGSRSSTGFRRRGQRRRRRGAWRASR